MTDSTYHEGFFVRGCVVEGEDATFVLVVKVSLPQLASLAHELVLEVEVPVLVITVELQVLLLGHIVNGHDTIVLLHGVVLEGGRGIWHHLLKVVHFVDVLSFVPDAVRLVDENEILVL